MITKMFSVFVYLQGVTLIVFSVTKLKAKKLNTNELLMAVKTKEQTRIYFFLNVGAVPVVPNDLRVRCGQWLGPCYSPVGGTHLP